METGDGGDRAAFGIGAAEGEEMQAVGIRRDGECLSVLGGGGRIEGDFAGSTVSSVTSLRVVVAPESVRVLTAEFTSRVSGGGELERLVEGLLRGIDGDDFQRQRLADADEAVDARDADINGRRMHGGGSCGR